MSEEKDWAATPDATDAGEATNALDAEGSSPDRVQPSGVPTDLSEMEAVLLAMAATQFRARGDDLAPGGRAVALYEAADLIDAAVRRLENP